MTKLSNYEVNKRAQRIVLEALEKRGEPAILDDKKVKGSLAKHGGWVLTQDDQNATHGFDYYFVLLPTEYREKKIYRVPCNKVVQWLREDHANWLSQPGRYGQKHNDNSVRRLVNRNKWMEDYVLP